MSRPLSTLSEIRILAAALRGLKYREIAAETGIPINTVGCAMQRLIRDGWVEGRRSMPVGRVTMQGLGPIADAIPRAGGKSPRWPHGSPSGRGAFDIPLPASPPMRAAVAGGSGA